MTRVALVCSLFILVALSRADNLVVNGGFETGTLDAWQTANFPQVVNNPNFVHSGSYAAGLGAIALNQWDYLTQDINTVPGTTYDLDFWLLNDNLGAFEVLWDGTSLMCLFGWEPSVYTQYHFTGLVATSGVTSLQFRGTTSSDTYFVDDIVVNAHTGVPEPSTLALLGSGLVFLKSRPSRRLRDPLGRH